MKLHTARVAASVIAAGLMLSACAPNLSFSVTDGGSDAGAASADLSIEPRADMSPPADLITVADAADFQAPDFNTADLNGPDLSVPDLSVPDLSVPDLNVPDLNVRDLTLPPDLTVLPDLTRLGPAPRFDSQAAQYASTAGGTGTVTFTGANFLPGLTVTVDGVEAQSVTWNSPTSLKLVVPPHPGDFGQVPVTVYNPDGQSATAKLIDYFPGTLAFGAPAALTNGNQPIGILTSDFNGDQILDLAVADYTDGNVSIFIGLGNGGFKAPVNYGTVVAAGNFTAGDFNNDGAVDLVLSGVISKDLVVLLGKGNGTFQPATSFGSFDAPQALTTADFDGDGNLDLLLQDQKAAQVLLGKGDGSFNTPVPLTLDASAILAVAAGDFDNDGKLDVVAAHGADLSAAGLVIWRGDRAGAFVFKSNQPIAGIGGSIAVADLDGNGTLDVVVTTTGPLALRLGKGDGTFSTPSQWSVSGAAGGQVFIADVNADRLLDLVYIDSSTSAAVGLGNGDGSFGAAQMIPLGVTPNDLALGDFDKDGKVDLALSAGMGLFGIGTSAIDVLLNVSK